MSKVFAFSTRARWRVSQWCAARLISGNGCSANEGRPKAPTHKRNKGKGGWQEEDGKQVWRGAGAFKSGKSINEASLLATAKSGETAALDTLYTERSFWITEGGRCRPFTRKTARGTSD